MRQARACGWSFAHAWALAVRPGQPLVMSTTPNPPSTAIRWSTDRFERVLSQDAIRATREAWRRAYEDVPPNCSERALMLLVGDGRIIDVATLQRAARSTEADTQRVAAA